MRTPTHSNTIWQRKALPLSALALLIELITSGCASDTSLNAMIPQSASDCSSGSASIEVGDGFLRILCGCTGSGEDNGRLYLSPGGLTCRVASAGTTVFFNYLTTSLPHQILSTGSPLFTSSAVSDPAVRSLSRTHTAVFSEAATTYTFQDGFSGMTGQITVP